MVSLGVPLQSNLDTIKGVHESTQELGTHLGDSV